MTTYTVSAGQTRNGITLNNGDTETVYSGGTANNTTVNSGGKEYIYSGAIVSGGSVAGGGIISGLLLTSGSVTVGSGNYQIEGITLHSGAIVTGLEIGSGAGITGFTDNGGNDTVDSGGSMSNTTLINGAQETIHGNANNVTVNAGSTESLGWSLLVEQPANYTPTLTNATINSGGSLTVYEKSVASNITVNSGGQEYLNGGQVIGGSVASGGIISGLVLAHSAVVANQSSFVIESITLHSGADITFIEITSGGSLHDFTVNSGTQDAAFTSGSVVSSIVNSGGAEFIGAGGIASATIVNTQGTEYIQAGGVASAVTVNSGGHELVFGVSYHDTVNSNGTVQAYGSENNAQINNGGIVDVSGVTSGSTINSGGNALIASGGLASNITVNNGGTLILSQGSTISGGSIAAGGVISGLLLASGGLTAQQGSFVFDSVNIHSGAQIGIEVASAASISGFVANSGSDLLVDNGGTATGTSITGGTVEYSGGASATQTVVFSGTSGTLKLDQASSFSGVISGFGSGETIDLTTISSIKSLAWNNGTLAISTSNAGIIDLNLAGNYQYAVFGFSSDNQSGTDISYKYTNLPQITGTAYNAGTGQLSITGNYLTASIGDYKVTDFTLTGDGGGKYTLTTGSYLTAAPQNGNNLTIQLSGADQLAIDGLLNHTGSAADSGAVYNLSASSGWDTGAAAISTQSITVGNVTAPSISSVTYNALTGVFTVTGTHLDNYGSRNGIALNDFKLAGNGSYSFSTVNDVVSNLSTTDFTITLSSTDKTAVNTVVNDNGTAAISGAAYNLTATANWDSNSGTAITSQTVSVSGAAPIITGAAYNAATGQLTVDGANLTGSAGGYVVSDLSLTGDGNSNYTLSSGSTITGTPSKTAVVIQLSAADQLAVDGLLNKNGATANDGKTAYSLSAGAGWDSGALATTDKAVSVSNVTAPTINSSSYNATTGVLTITGSNLDNHGAGNGINLSDLKLSAGNSSYSFSNTLDSVSNLNSNGFNISLSAADQTKLNAIVNDNGNFATNGSVYNLTASAGWDSDSGAAITTQSTAVTGTANSEILSLTLSKGSTFANPYAIAFDNNGNLYVTDVLNNKLNEIPVGSSTVDTVLSQGLNWPMGIAFNHNGDLFIANDNNGTIAVIAPNTNDVIAYTITTGGAPKGIAFDASGNLYYIDNTNNAIKEILAANITQTNPIPLTIVGSGLTDPKALAIDSAGDIYFTNDGNNSVKEILAGTHTAITLVSSGLNTPKGIAVDNSGNVYIADTLNNDIKEFAAGNHTVSTLLTGLNNPSGLTLDRNGNLYVANTGSNQIVEINHSNYLFNTSLSTATPTSINNLWENTNQIELSKSIFTAFAGQSSVTAAEFSNASTATSATDYLYYNAISGGLYYDADGSGNKSSGVEIAVIGVGSHPADLSLGDFKLVA